VKLRLALRVGLLATLVAAVGRGDVRAQAPGTDDTARFELSTSHIFTTRERPAVSLTFAFLDHLDFRVYKVKNAEQFFEQLKDPHVLGGFEPSVPQEPTWLERIASWKTDRRREIAHVFRRQLSVEYRIARRERADKQTVLRRTVNVNNFAQVPVLNASQLVTSWRELLPRRRDMEYRRIPLDIHAAGVYVVEAIDVPRKAYTIVVVSDAGLVTKTAPGEIFAFAANRFTGDPIGGCQVRMMLDQRVVSSGETGSDGVFRSDVNPGKPSSMVTLAQCGAHTALADPGAYWIRRPPADLIGYIYTDRPVYRPGHTVHYKAVVRWREKDVLGSVGRDPVHISIADRRGKVVMRDRRAVDEFGSLSGSYAIPMTAALGTYTVRAAIGDRSAVGTFDLQEYRKPEFDVAVRPSARRELQGRTVTVTIAARYYFGQPVSGGAVKYSISERGYFADVRDDGEGEDRKGDDDGGGFAYGDNRQIEGTAKLNDQGVAEIPVVLPVHSSQYDYALGFEARVTDASGRDVGGSAQIAATYGTFVVIANADRFVYTKGSTAQIDLRAVDYDGNAKSGVRMHVVLQRTEYQRRSGHETVTDLQTADVDSDAEGRGHWTVAIPDQSGSYRVRVTATSEGREIRDFASLWVPGGAASESEDDQRYLEVVTDQRTYRPGDTAHVAVRGAEFDQFVLVTKENQHVSYYSVRKAQSSGLIDVPIDSGDIGDTYVSITFLKDDRLFRAEHRLVVPAKDRLLNVAATPDKDVSRPGEPGTFSVHVTDSTGAPVRAQLSLGLVDEAIYGVKADTTPDPLRFFYRREYTEVGTSFSRDYPFTGFSGPQQLLLARRHEPMTFADFKADRPERPRVRKDFPDTAFWVADVTTNVDGNAQIHVEYPDSLTTWRLTARAVTVNTEVGSALARTLTTKDVIVRVVPPRFLTEGDQVSVPVVVHNYLPTGKNVMVSLTAEGLAADGVASSSRVIQVGSNGQQRTDWRYKADQVRPVTLTGKAITDTASDAMQMTLPVLPAGLQRNTGTSGSVVDAQPRTVDLTIPAAAHISGRSIRVVLMPSLAGSMLGALDYLTSYPWGCTEQTVSGFVPNLVVLRAFKEMNVAPPERLQSLDRTVDDALNRLYGLQHKDGGWGWWKTDENHPFMTAYAVDGLLRARESDAPVAGFSIYKGVQALIALYDAYPRAISDLKAYEVYVLGRAGPQARSFKMSAALDDLWSARSRMGTSGLAYLLMALDASKDSRADTAARELLAGVKTRGDLAWWEMPVDPFLDDIVGTNVEPTALALRALAEHDGRNALLERVARWLFLNRTTGYWYNTRQTAIALDGLLAYMRARGEHAEPFTADIAVNGIRVATHAFDATAFAAPDPVLVEAPAVEGANTVTITKRGAGTLYYDASVRYYDRPAASDRTGSRRLAVTRAYSTLLPTTDKNGHIVYREGAFTGTAKTGDLLLVRLTTAGSSDWKYLMLEDPIPAGTEAVEQPQSLDVEHISSWWFGSQREFRDDRTVFFLRSFSEGKYELTYLLKVTTPGTFTAMPTHIAPMYVPDVSASSATLSLTVPEGTP